VSGICGSLTLNEETRAANRFRKAPLIPQVNKNLLDRHADLPGVKMAAFDNGLDGAVMYGPVSKRASPHIRTRGQVIV